MKKLLVVLFAVAMFGSVVFVGETISVNAQETSVKRKRPVRGVVSGSKYIYRKGKNGVVYAYRKTAKGTVYVGKKTYQGGKYVTKKTVKGTKTVFRKTKNVIVN
jgi:hypothetical protein